MLGFGKSKKDLKELDDIFQKGWSFDSANPHVQKQRNRKAIKEYKKAADCGYSPALYRLGMIYLTGREDVKQDQKLAFNYFTKSAQAGDGKALYKLAELYEHGIGCEKNTAKAENYYKLSADQDYISAIERLKKKEGATMQQSTASPSSKPNTQQTPEVKEKEAPKPASKVFDNVPIDDALQNYIKAANAGNIQAQNALGMIYQKGYDVPQNDALAVKYYKMAADKNDPTAQYNLAVMIEDGHGCESDDEAAVALYKKSAQGGNIKALFALAKMYEKGWGVVQNHQIAEDYYIKAGQLSDSAFKMLRELSLQGNKTAENALLKLNEYGAEQKAEQQRQEQERFRQQQEREAQARAEQERQEKARQEQQRQEKQRQEEQKQEEQRQEQARIAQQVEQERLRQQQEREAQARAEQERQEKARQEQQRQEQERLRQQQEREAELKALEKQFKEQEEQEERQALYDLKQQAENGNITAFHELSQQRSDAAQQAFKTLNLQKLAGHAKRGHNNALYCLKIIAQSGNQEALYYLANLAQEGHEAAYNALEELYDHGLFQAGSILNHLRQEVYETQIQAKEEAQKAEIERQRLARLQALQAEIDQIDNNQDQKNLNNLHYKAEDGDKEALKFLLSLGYDGYEQAQEIIKNLDTLAFKEAAEEGQWDAISILKKLGDLGNENALYDLETLTLTHVHNASPIALIMLLKELVSYDNKEALNLLIQAAQRGHRGAYNALQSLGYAAFVPAPTIQRLPYKHVQRAYDILKEANEAYDKAHTQQQGKAQEKEGKQKQTQQGTSSSVSIPQLQGYFDKFDQIIGQPHAKQTLKNIITHLYFEKSQGRTPALPLLVVSGERAVGKTSIMTIFSDILLDIGLISYPLIYANQSDFVMQDRMHKKGEVKNFLKQARQGALLIEHTHQLTPFNADKSDKAYETLEFISKELNRKPYALCLILEGYPDEMREIYHRLSLKDHPKFLITLDEYSPKALFRKIFAPYREANQGAISLDLNGYDGHKMNDLLEKSLYYRNLRLIEDPSQSNNLIEADILKAFSLINHMDGRVSI